MKEKRNDKRTLLVIVIIALLAVGLLSYQSYKRGTNPAVSTHELAHSCTLDAYTAFHIHPHLRIIIDGVEEKIPADIGITLSCMNPLHTHDESGVIHIESPEQRDFTLGDFFSVWGKTFNQTQILDCKSNVAVDGNREVLMTVNGQPSDEFENLVLGDDQDVVIECGVFNNKPRP